MNQEQLIKRKKTSRRKFVLSSSAALLGLATMSSSNIYAASSKALDLAETKRDELISLLSQLISIRSQTGESAEEAQLLVNKYLSNLPYKIEKSLDRPSLYQNHPEYMPPNPPSDGPFVNLVGWPEKNMRATSAIFSHIDTHTIEAGWETDPYKPIIKTNRMYGLGTSDDKGGVAAMFHLEKKAQKERKKAT